MIDCAKLKNISYSYLVGYKNCGQYFKLKYIDKIPCFENTVSTANGKLVHNFCQSILSGSIFTFDAMKKYERTWSKFCGLYKKYIKENSQELDFIKLSSLEIIRNIKQKFDEQFPGFKVRHIEYLLLKKLEQYPQNFKGFIDIVLEMPDGNIIIADFKTCKSIYFFKEYEDKYKQYQLTLYKNYFSELQKIEVGKIETYFVLLEINAKSKNPIIFERVTSGGKKVSNALEWVNKSLKLINNGIFIKNRMHCFAYNKECPFRNTKYCSSSK